MIGGRERRTRRPTGPARRPTLDARSTTSARASTPATRARRRARATPTTSSRRSTCAASADQRADRPARRADFAYTGGSGTHARRPTPPATSDVARHLRGPPVHDRRRATATPAVTSSVTLGRRAPTTGTSTSTTGRHGDGELARRQLGQRRARRPSRSASPNPPRRRLRRSASSTSPPAGTLRRGKATFTQRARRATRRHGTAAYVGFCGFCDTITQGTPFGNGLATNVGGAKPGMAGSGRRLAHRRRPSGLPEPLHHLVQMDPADPRTVYVTLGGYGAALGFPRRRRRGHEQASAPATSSSPPTRARLHRHLGQPARRPGGLDRRAQRPAVVGTDVGVFIAPARRRDLRRARHGAADRAGLLAELKPGDPEHAVVATQGRGVYRYTFAPPPQKSLPRQPGGGAPAPGARRLRGQPRLPRAPRRHRRGAACASPSRAASATRCGSTSSSSRTGAACWESGWSPGSATARARSRGTAAATAAGG